MQVAVVFALSVKPTQITMCKMHFLTHATFMFMRMWASLAFWWKDRHQTVYFTQHQTCSKTIFFNWAVCIDEEKIVLQTRPVQQFSYNEIVSRERSINDYINNWKLIISHPAVSNPPDSAASFIFWTFWLLPWNLQLAQIIKTVLE